MLRLPKLEVATPSSLQEATALMQAHGADAALIAGGTDLLPNLKHGLLSPKLLVSLGGITELHGVREEKDGTLVIGAMTSLDAIANDARLARGVPALTQAASLVSGPQLRRMGTLGGNVMLDTRCRYYNQTHFWRKALGYCLKKDGTVCHVVAGGRKCIAAASNDTAPVLMTLGATLVFANGDGEREIPVDALWRTDGIWNKATAPGEILKEIRIPPRHAGHRGAYAKLRARGAIDFPLLGVAARVDVDDERIADADVVLVALQARPLRVKDCAKELSGTKLKDGGLAAAIDRVAARAEKQCHPLPNVPGDSAYRQDMVPVFVRRALLAATADA